MPVHAVERNHSDRDGIAGRYSLIETPE